MVTIGQTSTTITKIAGKLLVCAFLPHGTDRGKKRRDGWTGKNEWAVEGERLTAAVDEEMPSDFLLPILYLL